MRVAIDATPLVDRRTGVGTYVYYLLKHLVNQDTGTEYAGLACTRRRLALADLAGTVPIRHVHVPTRAMYWIWTYTGRPFADRLAGGCDVFHATNFFVPPTRYARRVVTIHDLSFLIVPEYSSPRIVTPFSRHIERFVAESDAIVACSESTRRDLIERLKVEPGRIHVVPEAADTRFRPCESGANRVTLSETYDILEPYILFVGAIEPRKNIETVIESFASISGDVPHTLVIAGPKAWGYEAVLRTYERVGLGDRVRFLDYVPDEHLPALYQGADLFVFLSHYEGFGLPPLEAMQCGCPVLVADNSSMPEVVGDAGLCVSATDRESASEAMRTVLTDADLRSRMSAAGIEQAKGFSWTECARRTARVYRYVAE